MRQLIGCAPLWVIVAGACAGETGRVADGGQAPPADYGTPNPCSGDGCPAGNLDGGGGGDSETSGAGAGYSPLPPFRLLDTRDEGASLGSGSTRCLRVTGDHGVPAAAKAVAVNLVAVQPSGRGYLAAYPKGTPKPEASTLNYQSGQVIANGAIVMAGSGGEVCVYVHTATHLIVDVNGYFPEDARYFPVQPLRKLDTRDEASMPGSGTTRCLALAGTGGVPATAKAVALNLAVAQPTAKGYLSAFPKGAARPEASSLNYAAGEATANGALVRTGDGGQVCLYVHEAAQLIVDVVGYFDAGARYTPITPLRRLDTRDGPLPAWGATRCVRIGGSDGIPAAARVAAVNVAAVAPGQAGYLVLYPEGQERPETSTLNFQPGAVRSNNALVELGEGGKLCVYNHTASHWLLDVVGYW